MTEQELYNEYRKSDCKSFTDFLINKITELKKTYRKQRNKRIDELQKENAELKARLKEHESIGNAQFWENVWSWKTKAEQLTKAKEIIKKFLLWENDWHDKTESKYELLKEAEQFLNEVEK